MGKCHSLDVLKERKNRYVYLLAVALTIALGLASRRFSDSLPEFIAENAGDMLWAMMVYFGFRVLFLNKSMLFAFILSMLFSFGIEFSQLYQADWINQIRNKWLFGLILGKGFLYVDLIRYTFGIIISLIIDFLGNNLKLRDYK